MSEILIEGALGSVVDLVFDTDQEIDPHVLKRKGIEPGSKEHKKLEFHENFSRDFYRKSGSSY